MCVLVLLFVDPRIALEDKLPDLIRPGQVTDFLMGQYGVRGHIAATH
jgi:hypothetical protein